MIGLRKSPLFEYYDVGSAQERHTQGILYLIANKIILEGTN